MHLRHRKLRLRQGLPLLRGARHPKLHLWHGLRLRHGNRHSKVHRRGLERNEWRLRLREDVLGRMVVSFMGDRLLSSVHILDGTLAFAVTVLLMLVLGPTRMMAEAIMLVGKDGA